MRECGIVCGVSQPWQPSHAPALLQEAFPTRVRTTAHGISAAMGKVRQPQQRRTPPESPPTPPPHPQIGATAGSYGLLNQFNSYCDGGTCTVGTSVQSQISQGVIAVMAICCGVSVSECAACPSGPPNPSHMLRHPRCAVGNVMALFLPETGNKEFEEVDASSKVLATHDREGAGATPSSPSAVPAEELEAPTKAAAAPAAAPAAASEAV